MKFYDKEKNTIEKLYMYMYQNELAKYIMEFENDNIIEAIIDTVYESDSNNDFKSDEVEYEEYNVIVIEIVKILKKGDKTFKKGMLYELMYFNFPKKITDSNGIIIYNDLL